MDKKFSKCSKCLRIMPVNCFRFRKDRGRPSYDCIECEKLYYQQNKEKNREYQKEWIKNNRKKYNAMQTRYRNKKKEKRKEFLKIFFNGLVCKKCGYDKSFSALHFHHLNPNEKKDRGDTFNRWFKDMSFDKFKEKIKNTALIILCANCHAELHANLWKI